jgi:uncharacterized membrane protein
MLRNLSETRQSKQAEESTRAGADRRLQLILWILWTIAVITTGYLHWRADLAAGQPANVVGIVIYSLLTGMIGLVVMTIVEIWLEPQRFVE